MRYEIDFCYTIQWKAEWKCIQIQLRSTFGGVYEWRTLLCVLNCLQNQRRRVIKWWKWKELYCTERKLFCQCHIDPTNCWRTLTKDYTGQKTLSWAGAVNTITIILFRTNGACKRCEWRHEPVQRAQLHSSALICRHCWLEVHILFPTGRRSLYREIASWWEGDEEG